ncbi:MAG: dihydroneopterin aldolase [Glaciimonas sp.]|nr:dihydroneopterin aldolase [Glaciimonas sp.]
MKHENIASHVGGMRWQIFIDGLNLMTHVGLHDHEFGQLQAVELNIEMSYRINDQPNHKNDADGMIDYDKYCIRLSEFMLNKPHTRLLEILTSEVASLSFSEYPMLEEIKVAIHKPKIRENAARLGVAASWTRWSYETMLLQQPVESLLSI